MKILELPANFLPWLMKTNENSKFVRLSFIIYSNGGKTGLKSRIILKLLRKFHPTLIISRCCSGCDLKLAAFHPVSELGWLFFLWRKTSPQRAENSQRIYESLNNQSLEDFIFYEVMFLAWPARDSRPTKFSCFEFYFEGEKKSSKIYTRIRKCQKFLCSLLSDLSLRGSGGQIIKRWENGEIFRFSRYSQWKKQNL